MADDVTFYDEIEAYCGRLSYSPDESATLHVSTQLEAYDVQVERWGRERQTVWTATNQPGAYTPPPGDADTKGCDWPVSLEIPLGEDWRTGFYLVTVTGHGARTGRDVAHAGFVLRADREAKSKAVLVLATNTWNAYNIWGGCSLYTGGSEVSFRRPLARGFLSRPEVERDDRKARPVRWGEEPDADGMIYQKYRMDNGYSAGIGSSGWFTFERRFVEWAESNGFEFDYAISTDLETDGFLDGYQTLISIGHDEYVSAPQRREMERHVEAGGHLISLSGNTMFWQVRIADDGRGDDSVMVCHKYSAHETDPVMGEDRHELMTGMWCDPVVNDPEWRLLGAGSAYGLYHRFGLATARGVGGFTVYRDDHWMFEGTELRYGDVLGAKHGVVGYETLGCRLTFDEFQLPIALPNPDMPREVEIVAFAIASNCGVGEYPASISAKTDQGDLEFIASRFFGDLSEESKAKARHGNSVMLTCKPYERGGEVITVGTTDWVFGLADDPAVARVTANILNRFLA